MSASDCKRQQQRQQDDDMRIGLELDLDNVDSPVFNYHSVEPQPQDPNLQFTIEQDDELLPPVLDPEELTRRTRRSVISAVELDGLAESDFPDEGRNDKPDEDVARIIRQIKNIVLFEGYDEDELKLVTDYMFLKPVKEGEIVIKHGSVGDAIYVVKSGKYRCTVPGMSVAVRIYTDDGFFGELALINRAPRAATITAITDGELWVLNALRNAWLRKHRAILNSERFEQVIKAIPLFRDNLNTALTSQVIDALEEVRLQPGEVICTQGEPGDAMYFIMKGEVEVCIDGQPVKVMSKNEFFGERALVLDEGRAATCRAATKVKLAKLPRENFCLIMPDSVIDRIKQHIAASYKPSSHG